MASLIDKHAAREDAAEDRAEDRAEHKKIMRGVNARPRVLSMTPKGWAKLSHLAVLMAIEAPARRNKHAVSATVDWRSIEEARAILEAEGIDWRAMVESAEAIKHHERGEAVKRMQQQRGQRPHGE